MRARFRIATSLALAVLSLSMSAQAASIATFFGRPAIAGQIRPGEAEEARTDLTGHFDKPLQLKVDADSNSLEVMRIGLWLRDQHPDIQLRTSCVGACAWFMLDSGRSLKVASGTVIAFGMLPELWASLSDQIQRGDLSIDDQRSKDILEDFRKRVPAARWDAARQLRQTREQQAHAPAWVQTFVEQLTALQVQRLVHDEHDVNMRLTSSAQQCLWWVPDAQGLKQLGLDVPGYQPVKAEAAAKLLKVPVGAIYVGPALRELPEQPLCVGTQGNEQIPDWSIN